MTIRWCWGPCGRELPETLDCFERTGRGGHLARVCRRCRAVRHRDRYHGNASVWRRAKAWRRAYRARPDVREARSVYQREYFQRRGKGLQRQRRAAA